MDASPQVRVTLSDDLLIHLRKVAHSKHVPIRWLVAGLVCDTLWHSDYLGLGHAASKAAGMK